MGEHGIRGISDHSNNEGSTLENLRAILHENERLKNDLKQMLDINLKDR